MVSVNRFLFPASVYVCVFGGVGDILCHFTSFFPTLLHTFRRKLHNSPVARVVYLRAEDYLCIFHFQPS